MAEFRKIPFILVNAPKKEEGTAFRTKSVSHVRWLQVGTHYDLLGKGRKLQEANDIQFFVEEKEGAVKA